MSDSKDNVKVALRIRPLNAKELSENTAKCISTLESKTILLDSKPESRSFTYDYIASEEVTQEGIFDVIGKPIATSCIKGYNGTIFAYGQTGTGKTFTIQGMGYEEYSLTSKPNYHLRGILPRCFEYIFSSIADETALNNTQYLIKCSYLEIYQEAINDLLDQNPRNLQLREDMKKGVYVEGLLEETVRNAMETYELLDIGTRNRHVSSTSMNKESSRSHSVFTLIIESKTSLDGLLNFKTSRFHLIDLAGSERQKATDCVGERLKEAGMINKSLSALGNVINSLVDISEGRSRHVHYRDSKLTFLLKDSLGGNSKTFIVANISPSVSAFAETLSTLKFAQRAKMIRNAAVVNEDVSGTVNILKYEIKKLKDELAQKRNFEPSSVCPKCNLMSNRSVEIYDFLDNTKELEFLIEKNTRLRINSEKQLEQEILDKDKQIKALRTALVKVENKANHDKMILKFRDATIAKLQSGVECNEVENMRKENLALREQVENNPVAAQLFVENERLKSLCESLKKEAKWDPESYNGRIRDNQDYTEKLSDVIKNWAVEKEEIMKMINEMVKENERLKGLIKEMESEMEIKVKGLESEKDGLVEKVKELIKKQKTGFGLEEEENLIRSAEKIDGFLKGLLGGDRSIDIVTSEKGAQNMQDDIMNLRQVNEGLNDKIVCFTNRIKELEESLAQSLQENAFLKDKAESKDNSLNQILQEVENLTDSCEFLKSTIESLQNQITEKNNSLITTENTNKRLEAQISELLISLGSTDSTQKSENLIKIIENLENSNKKLNQKHENLSNDFIKLQNSYEIAKEQEFIEKKNVKDLYIKLSSVMEELQEYKEREQNIYEKIEIAEEGKTQLLEKIQKIDQKKKKLKIMFIENNMEKIRLKERIDELVGLLDEEMGKNMRLKGIYDMMENDNEELIRDRKEFGRKMKALQDELIVAKREMEKEIKVLKDEIEEIKQQKVNLEEEIRGKEENKMMKEEDQKENIEFMRLNMEKEREVEDLKEKYKELSEKSVEIELCYKELRCENIGVNRKLGEVQEMNTLLARENEIIKEEVYRITEENDGKTKEIDEIMKKYTRVIRENKEIEDKYRCAREEYEKKVEELEEVVGKYMGVVKENERLGEKIRYITVECADKDKELEGIQDKYTEIADDNDRLIQKNEDVTNNYRQITEEFELLQSKYAKIILENTQNEKNQGEILNNYRKKLEELEEKYNKNNQIIEENEKIIEKNVLELDRMGKELKESRENYLNEKEESVELGLQITHLAREIIEKDNQIDEIIENLNNSKEQLAESHIKINQLAEKNQKLELKLEEFYIKDQENQNLLDKLQSLSLNATSSATPLTVSDFCINYQKLLSKKQKLEQKLKTSKDSLQNTEELLSEQLKISEKNKKLIESLQKSIQTLESNSKNSYSAYIENKNLLTASELLNESLKSQIKLLETKLQAHISSNDKQVQTLQNEKADLQSLLYDNSITIQSLHEKILDQEAKTDELTESNNAKQSIINEKLKTIKKLEGKIVEENEQKEQVLKEKTALEGIINDQEECIKGLRGSLEEERSKCKGLTLKNMEIDRMLGEKEELICEWFEKFNEKEDAIGVLNKKIKDQEEKNLELLRKIKQAEELSEKIQSAYKKLSGQLSNYQESQEKISELEEVIFKMKINYKIIMASLQDNSQTEEDFSDFDKASNKLIKSIQNLLSSKQNIENSLETKEQLLSQICTIFSLESNDTESLIPSLTSLKQNLDEIQKSLVSTKELLQIEKKLTEILSKEKDILRGKIAKTKQNNIKELKILQESLHKNHLLIPDEINSKINQFESSTQELNEKIEELSIENTGLREKITEITKIKDKAEKDLFSAKEEIEGLKEENKSKMEILRNTNKNILLTRNEINMWKKCLDEKNSLIQDLRADLKAKNDEIGKLAYETNGKFRINKDQDINEPDIRYLNQILKMKDKEIQDLKEKGQEYYEQADEALENQKKEIENFNKRCAALKNEVKKLKEDLKNAVEQKESMSGEVKKLRINEYKMQKDYEEMKRVVQQLKEEKNKLHIEVNKDNDIGQRNRVQERMRQENIAMKGQIEKLNQELMLIQKQNDKFISKNRETNEIGLRADIEKQAEEISKLNESLSRITAFVFSLPNACVDSNETNIADSTINTIKNLMEIHSKKDGKARSSRDFEDKQNLVIETKNQIGKCFAFVGKTPKSPGNCRYKSAFK
ncbi:hypothetical protein SteCoe_15645 [Stentor coeruleus]|uniref:Kinesin motor domain-containing protein n=1 Tax=Stentor coeruleus TaxID=5963 RepID=A0A1R2C322_9CILI|nr:hypothetical protein SteCoe_15645 [Stentor coeruleus]